MITAALKQNIGKVLEDRKPSRAFRELCGIIGDSMAFKALDEHLGDFPDASKIRRCAAALDSGDFDLKALADSPVDAVRRVSRLVLLEGLAGSIEEAQLQKGLTDPYGPVRCDAARLTGSGADRTRIYNQLIRLIREDPDVRVRRTAGRRLADSFADLYSVDFDGLPPLSRMLILDALVGHSRIDEERAELLLMAEKGETAFRAARCLLKWGTLGRLFMSDGGSTMLDRAAETGVADYLEQVNINTENRAAALKLAKQAGRSDLIRRLRLAPPETTLRTAATDARQIEKSILEIQTLKEPERSRRIEALNPESSDFRISLENIFPPPDVDVISTVILDVARMGKWTEWKDRVIRALSSEDPDIRRSATLAVAGIAPDEAATVLPPLLNDPADRVRSAAAETLASLPSGRGCTDLLEIMNHEVDSDILRSVTNGIRSAGGAALARCILNNQEELDPEIAGALLTGGVDEVCVELLADGITEETRFTQIMSNAGVEAGESIVSAWRKLDGNARKKMLQGVIASGWADMILKPHLRVNSREYRRFADLTRGFDGEERRNIFEPVLEQADGRSRRLVRKIMKT